MADDPFAGLFGLSSATTTANNSSGQFPPSFDFGSSIQPTISTAILDQVNEESPQSGSFNNAFQTNSTVKKEFVNDSFGRNNEPAAQTTQIMDFSLFNSQPTQPIPCALSMNLNSNIPPIGNFDTATSAQQNEQDIFSVFSSNTPVTATNNSNALADPFKELISPTITQENIQKATNSGQTEDLLFPSQQTTPDDELYSDEGDDDNDIEGNEDIFEQAYDIAKALELKLKENHSYDVVQSEMNQLVDVLKTLESQVQERDEDARRLLKAFQFARDKGPAPPPPTDQSQTHNQTIFQTKNKEYTSQEIRAVINMQRLFRKARGDSKGHLSDVVLYYKAHPDQDAQNRIQWHKTIKELMRNEQIYVRKLYLLINCFMLPLERKIKQAQQKATTTANSTSILPSGINTLINQTGECKIATPKQFNEMFMNIKVIYSFHETLLKNLRQAYFFWPRKTMKISEIFQQLIPYMKAYVNYFTNYATHLRTLSQLQKHNKSFVNWIRSVQRTHLDQLASKQVAGNIAHIPDLSIAPIQHIYRYETLLDRLVSHGEANHADLLPLQKVLGELKKLTTHVAEFKKTNENMKELFRIQSTIIGTDAPNVMNANRFFIRDGAILTLTDRIHRRHLYVFNDILILTKKTWKPGSNEQVFNLLIPLQDAIVTDDIEVPCSFRICYNKGEKFMSFVANSDEEKATWMRDITNALADSVSHLKPSQRDQTRIESSQPHRTSSKQGYLSKMEGGFIKTWKTRWIQVAAGILYSFLNDSDSVPLRSYHLKEYIIKQMYVTDNFTRYCVHMVQLNGKRQIILSTYSKEILEEWLVILKESVDMKNSLVFGDSEMNSSSPVVEPPPVIISSAEESEKSFSLDRTRFFPQDVSDQFIATVNDKKAYRMYFDKSGEGIKLQMGENGNKTNSQQENSKTAVSSVSPVSIGIVQPKLPSKSILPGFEEQLDFPPGITGNSVGQSIAPPSPYAIRSAPTNSEGMDFSSVQRHESRGGADQGSSYQLPQQVIAFQTKFNLPPSERPVQYFPLASSCFIFLTKRLLCVESLFQGNQAIPFTDIAKLHKSKPGILGKGTGGRVELKNGSMIELSGMIKRRDTFHAIVAQAKQINCIIPVYRDGFGKEG